MTEKLEEELIQALISEIRDNNSIPLGEFPIISRQVEKKCQPGPELYTNQC